MRHLPASKRLVRLCSATGTPIILLSHSCAKQDFELVLVAQQQLGADAAKLFSLHINDAFDNFDFQVKQFFFSQEDL